MLCVSSSKFGLWAVIVAFPGHTHLLFDNLCYFITERFRHLLLIKLSLIVGVSNCFFPKLFIQSLLES